MAALTLTSTPFGLQAYIGVIMLGGIVVNNAILLVDYTNVLRRRDGTSQRDTVELAGRTRLRPTVMTTPAWPLMTPGLVRSVLTLFEEGWTGLRRGAAHSNPEQA